MADDALGLPFVDAELENRVRAKLLDVEKELHAAISSDSPFVEETARHLLDAGGKRFRPMLVVLASEFGDAASSAIIPACLVVELTHVATLYHDDVMDEADLRRGAPSVNARWTNSVAILAGDFLFARASDIVSDLGPDAVRIQARTFSRLVQGQIRETIGPRAGEDPVEHYLSVIADKTGSLIATSARFGARLSGAPGYVEDVLMRYGEQIGIAFQLSDDVIDVASETSDLGKAHGTDLREGIPTLPTLFAQRSSRPQDARLLSLLSGPLLDDAEHAEALALLRCHSAVDQARDEVKRRTKAARELLTELPAIAARDALDALCDLVETRTS